MGPDYQSKYFGHWNRDRRGESRNHAVCRRFGSHLGAHKKTYEYCFTSLMFCISKNGLIINQQKSSVIDFRPLNQTSFNVKCGDICLK